jgi:PAS domain S-box-containing protein
VRPFAGGFCATLGHRRALLWVDTALVVCFVAYVVLLLPAQWALLPGHDLGPPVYLAAAVAALALLVWAWLDYRRDAATVERLRESEARFQLLAAQIPADVWTTDTELRLKTVLGSLIQRLENSAARVPGRTLYEIFATTDATHPAIAAHLQALRGEAATYERLVGDVVLEGHVEPLRDASGRVIGCVGIALDVTARRADERERRLLADALEGASDMISVTDAENRFVYVNEGFLRTYGYTREEIIGQTPAILGPPAHVPGEILAGTLQGGWSGDLINRRKDGTEVAVSLHTSAIRDSEGRLLGLLGVARDISEQRREGEALRASRERFELAARATEEAIWEQSFTADTTWWSDGLFRVLGYVPSDVNTDREWWEKSLHPDDRERVLGGWQRAVEGGDEVWGDEFRIRRVDGAYADVSSRGFVVRDAAGKAQRMVGALADISYRKQAEAVAGRYRALVESSEDAIISTDLEGLVESWNPAAERLFGYAVGEMIGRPIAVLEPSGLAGEMAALRAHVVGGERPAYETTRRRRDGTLVAIATRLSPILDHEGKLIGVSAILRDITEQRRAAAAARESEEHSRLLAEAAFDALAIHDGGVLLSANRQYFEMFGYRPEELLGRPVVPLTVAAEAREFMERQIAAGGLGPYESVGMRKDGTTFPMEIRVRETHYGGRQVRVGALRDLTEHKLIEQALRQRAEAADRLERLATAVPGAVYVLRVDAGGQLSVSYGGPMLARVLDLADAPLERNAAAMFDAMHPDDRPRAEAMIAEAARTLVPGRTEFRIRRGAGDEVWVETRARPKRMPDGSTLFYGFAHDVTERKRAEHALGESEVRLRALARHLESVREEEHTRMARAIHDEVGQALTALRLDLTWIGGKLGDARPALRRKLAEMVALADETIEAGRRIVAELRPPVLDDLGLVPALEWYTEHFGKRAGLRVELDVGRKAVVVGGQIAVTVYRIIQEAVTNVARHANAKHVTVRLREQDDLLKLEIADDGVGIPSEALESVQSFGIIGMRERTMSQGGALEIEGSPGRGTVVRVEIPVERHRAPPVGP